jgi:hypothetical protein
MISKDIIINADGTTTIVDKRTFSDVVSNQIYGFKKAAEDEILKSCPEYKQRNAALGLLTAEETEFIKTTIQHVRTKCHELEQQVLAIHWDGNESTRGEACDAVQNTHWYWG